MFFPFRIATHEGLLEKYGQTTIFSVVLHA